MSGVLIREFVGFVGFVVFIVFIVFIVLLRGNVGLRFAQPQPTLMAQGS